MQSKKSHVFLLYKAMIPSVMLCGHCQIKELAAQGLIEYRHACVRKVKRKDLNWADIILLCRLDTPYECELVQMLKKAHKTIAYIMDDDLLHVPACFSSGAHYAKEEVQVSIKKMITMSDAIVSPSPMLLSKYTRCDQKGILLEEPAIAPLGYTSHDPAKPIRIGFAGSADRTDDIEMILGSALSRIKEEYGNRVEFIFYGAIPSCAAALEAQCIPFSSSYDGYRKTMNALQLDIGLAPMPDTEFHACKHYNKFIEYAATNAVGIFSAAKPYDRIAEQFDWKLLCENTPDCWYAAIKNLLDHPEELDALKRKTAVIAATQFNISAISHTLWNQLEALIHQSHQRISLLCFLQAQKRSLFRKIMIKVKKKVMFGGLKVNRNT